MAAPLETTFPRWLCGRCATNGQEYPWAIFPKTGCWPAHPPSPSCCLRIGDTRDTGDSCLGHTQAWGPPVESSRAAPRLVPGWPQHTELPSQERKNPWGSGRGRNPPRAHPAQEGPVPPLPCVGSTCPPNPRGRESALTSCLEGGAPAPLQPRLGLSPPGTGVQTRVGAPGHAAAADRVLGCVLPAFAFPAPTRA